MKISLCMIVKNEEKYIKQCLENALNLVDEAIVVDTGSTDSTINIIKENFAGKVTIINHNWEDNFAAARNISLEYATGDWILMLDADEKLICDKEKLITILEEAVNTAYIIPIYNFQSNGTVDYSTGMIRLYKNDGTRYIGAIHEQLNFKNGIPAYEVLDNIMCKIFHYGYLLSTFLDKSKLKRNTEIIKSELNKNPNSSFNWYNLGVMDMIEGKFEVALDSFIKSNKISNGKRFSYSDDLVLRMTICLIKLKQYKMCREFLEKVLQDSILNKTPDLHYYDGLVKKKLGSFDKAIKSFEMCIEIGEINKGISQRGMGSYKPMLEIARILIENSKISEGVIKYMEAVFNKNNYLKDGAPELISVLKKYNMEEVLVELEKQLDKKVS